jgi:hypothetical protein
MTWGQDFSGRSMGYDYAAVLQFQSREALAAYSNDPIHLEIVGILNRLAEPRLVVDYETGTSVSST